MLSPSAITAVVLAGGRGRRLGTIVKPLIEINGQTVLARLEQALLPFASELLVSVAEPVTFTQRRQVVDEVAGCGPLAGLCAAFSNTDTPWLLVVGGDMPYVEPALLQLLLTVATTSEADAVVPRIGTLAEPLLALYHRRCHEVARARLLGGKLSLNGLLSELSVTWVSEEQVRSVDAELRSFTNLNEPRDLPLPS